MIKTMLTRLLSATVDLKITLLYFIASIIWLSFGDYVMDSGLKMALYVIGTVIMVYFLLKKDIVQLAGLKKENVAIKNKLLMTEKLLTSQIDELVQCKNIVRDQNEYLRAFLKTIPDLILVFDKEGLCLDCNALYGENCMKQKQFPVRSIYEILPAAVAKQFLQVSENALQSGEEQRLEYQFPVNNRLKYWEARFVALNSKYVVAIVRDITQEWELYHELDYINNHDPLTNLYNRTYFEQQMQSLQEEGSLPISIFVVDLDKFKNINDTLGHKQGDYFLKEAALLLKRAFRADDVVARIGGDEFAVLLPNTSYDLAQTFYDRLKRVEATYRMMNPAAPLRMSVGFATSKSPKMNIDELFICADNHMYQEKRKCAV